MEVCSTLVRRALCQFNHAIPAISLTLLLIACGSGSTGTATRLAPPASSPAPLPSGTATAPGISPSPSGSSFARTITEANNGATVPVAVGDQIALALRVPPGSDPWQVRQPDPHILAPIPNPAAASVGVTLYAYRAVGPGQVAITAESRPHCDPGAACPGLIQGFKVTIVVATP